MLSTVISIKSIGFLRKPDNYCGNIRRKIMRFEK